MRDSLVVGIAGCEGDDLALRIEANRVVAGLGFQRARRRRGVRDAGAPVRHGRTLANRVTRRRQAGHRGDLLDVDGINERCVRARPWIRITEVLDGVPRLGQHAAPRELQRQIRARPREVIDRHRDAEKDCRDGANHQREPRHAAHRDDFRTVVGERALDDDIRIRSAVCRRARQPPRFERGLETLQINPKIRNALIPKVRILLERLLDDPFELQRQPARHRTDRRGFAFENRDQQIGRRRRGERRPACDELVEHHAKAVAIRSSIDREPSSLFRRHVGDGADDRACARLDGRRDRRVGIGGRGPAPRESGDTEVEHLHVAVGPQHQVVGLDVAMHDRCGMSRRKRRRRLYRDVEDFAQVQRAARDPLAQRLALDELRDEESRAVVIAGFMDGEDVRMVEGRGGARFMQEAAHPLRIAGKLGAQHFQRDRPAEGRIDGLVNLSHAAAAQQVLDLIAADGCTRLQCHRRETLSRFRHRCRGVRAGRETVNRCLMAVRHLIRRI